MERSVLLIALGGTIAMQGGSQADGIVPRLTGADLVSALPGLAEIAAVTVRSPFLLPGASLALDHLAGVAALIREGLEAGHCGAVVVQGTDTIEETAFVLDRIVSTDRPIVVTGAMRGAEAPGADGPANLLAAVRTAAAESAAGLGALVVLNDEIHAAQFVRKGDTGLPSAFVSPPFGPIGRVSEGTVRIAASPLDRPPALVCDPAKAPPVALVQTGLGDDGRLLSALADLGFAGAIVAGMGAGHVPAPFAEALERLVPQMPVVLASRVGAGPVFSRTYGFPGSEIDLIGKGVIPTGDLGPAKARLLLQLLLAAGASRAAIGRAFAEGA